jgi:tetratricopeptide (TPR) repeat protein
MKKPTSPVSLPRITFFSGLFLLLLIGGLLIGIYGSGAIIRNAERDSEFSRLLGDYDFKYRMMLDTESPIVQRQEFENLHNDLDRLEKKAVGVESWLSILKRRRQLAYYVVNAPGQDIRYMQSYLQSSQRAAHAFPYSEPIAAVAAAALVYDTAITRDAETSLKKTLPLLASSRLSPMRLALHVLLGDFRNPERAAASLAETGQLPHFAISEFLNFNTSLSGRETGMLAADLSILKIIAGDPHDAATDIQTALISFPSPELIRLAAEYYYDFGSMVRSAELFSMLPDISALSRQADALWLAGYAGTARTIWTMLTVSQERSGFGGTGVSPRENDVLFCRALYNLAQTAPTGEEKATLLQRLVQQSPATDSRQYGLICFSRLFDAPQALAVLNAERGPVVSEGLYPVDVHIDLEMLKRRTEVDELARVIAELWLLLDRHPAAEDIYQWGVWYCNLQRNYTENAMLLRNATRHYFTGWWLNFYEALRLIREGNLNAAETLLATIPTDTHWAAAANLGRIYEARHAPARALENYERAMAVVMASDLYYTASKLQVNIARCLKTLGKVDECRRALEFALDLNEDNLNARLELSRLN